jgi:Mg2+ and Co2+ transporter CorA
MKIAEQVKDLDNEIEELHNYAVLLEDKERNKSLFTLSLIGALFIIPAFITGFYGMNIFEGGGIKNDCWYLVVIPLLIIVPIVVWIHQKAKNATIKWMLMGILITLLLAVLFVPLMFNKC